MPLNVNLLPPLDSPVTEAMSPDYQVFYEYNSVKEVLTTLRNSPQSADGIKYFYVVDSDRKLLGVISTRRLLFSEPEVLVKNIMINSVVSVEDSTTFGEAADLMRRKKLLALPVVNSDGQLMGIVDVTGSSSEVLDFDRRDTADRVFQLVGVHLELQPNASMFRRISDRFPWLLCNIASGLAAAWITGLFDQLLQRLVVLALFIPVVLALSESVAMQSLSISVQRLKLTNKGEKASYGDSLKELFPGAVLGLLSGILVASPLLLWLQDLRLSLVVAFAIGIGCAIGSFLGSILPQLVHQRRLDPKVASGPAALALTDMATILSYMLVAEAML